MKRLIFTLAALVSLAAGAQSQQGAFYIYCNDGGFDAFLPAKVDSIVYSRTDIYGEEHDAFVTQEIWSQGQVSRLPIASVEKVDFQQPETLVSNDVFPLTSYHDPFVVEANTEAFTLSSTTPAEMRPVRGNVVVARSDCRSFENGIIARVKDIQVTSEGNYSYICEPADLDDVFDQIVIYDSGVALDNDNSDPESAQAPRRVSIEREFEIWNKEFEGTIASIEGSHYRATDKATVEIKIRKTLTTPLYANITLHNDFAGNVSYECHAQKEFTPDPVQIGKTLKVGRISFPHPLLCNLIWLEPQISIFGYFEARGELDVEVAAHLNRSDVVSLTYSDKKWQIDHTPTMDAAVDAAKLSLNGSVEAGLKPEILLALNGSSTGVGIKGKVGVKQTLNLQLDGLQIYDEGVYRGIKDVQTYTYLTYNTAVFVQSGLFDKDTPRKEYSILDSEKRLLSKYIFPNFSNGASQHLGQGLHSVSFDAERDIIIPVDLSMRLYDEDGTLVQTSPERVRYNKNTNNYSFSFADLDLTRTYTAYPVIHLGDFNIQASPAITVNQCPASVTGVQLVLAYLDRNDATYPNTMVYTVHAELTDTDNVTEWGVALGTTLYPFSEVSESNARTFATGVPAGRGGSYYRIDYDNFVFEFDRTISVYVKRLDKNGNTVITYSDPYEATLRYDTPPSLTYSDPKIAKTELIGTPTSAGQMQFRTIGSYHMALQGTFWVDYIDAGVNGVGFFLTDNPEWRPTYDGEWDSTWTSTYWSTNPYLNHSNWHNLHLRNGSVIPSDYFNWVGGTGGVMASVNVTSAADAPAPAGAKRRDNSSVNPSTDLPTIPADATASDLLLSRLLPGVEVTRVPAE